MTTTSKTSKTPSRLRQLASDAGLYVAGFALRRALSVITMPVFTRYLSTAGYGVLAIVGSVQNMLEVFYEMGLGSAATRFYYDAADPAQRRRLFATLLVFSSLATAALTGLLFLVGPALWALVGGEIPFYPYLALTLGGVFLGNFAVLPRVLFRVCNQVPTFFRLSLAQSVATVALSLYCVIWLEMGPVGPVLATFVVAALFTGVYLAYLWPWVKGTVDWRLARRAVGFGAPEIPLRWGRWALRASDRLILRHFTSLSTVAFYSVGTSIAKMPFDLVGNGIHWAIVPFFYATATQESQKRSTTMFARIATYNVLILVALGLATIMFAHELIAILASARYAEAEQVVPLIVAASLLESSFYIPSKGLYLKNKTAWLLPLFLVPAAMNIGLNFLFVPLYGMLGAACSMLLGYSVMITLTLIVSQRVYPIPYEYGRIAKVIAAGFLLWGVSLVLPETGWAAQILAKTAVLALYPLLLWAMGFFQDAELSWLRARMAILRPSSQSSRP
jgi:O-antigen/teichoic acid export membrane protein